MERHAVHAACLLRQGKRSDQEEPRKLCNGSVMNAASGDTVDVGDSSDVLILRNSLKGKSSPGNPAYRPVRRFFSMTYGGLSKLTVTR